ncbi:MULTISPECIES: DUF5455 family protein [Bacteria]|uniref:DUF5455 family protein n=4 Tax=cellular organisms TaxID=131567 RepID=UPI0034E97BB4
MPLLAAIPAFLASLAAAASQFFAYIIYKYGRKLVLGAAFIIAYTAIIVVFVSTLNSEFSKLLSTLPNNSFSQAGLSLVPSNAITCAGIIIAVKIAQMVYNFTIGILKIKFKA